MMARVTDNRAIYEAFAENDGMGQGYVLVPTLFSLIISGILMNIYRVSAPWERRTSCRQLANAGQNASFHNYSRDKTQMEFVGILFLLQTCLAVDFNVGEDTTFLRFDFTYPVTQVTASSPAIKSGDCKREEFCYQIFNASRGAIVRGTISEPVSAVIFYVRRSSTPRAIVITRKDAQNKEPTLPRGTIVDKTVDLEAGYHFEYLVIFKNEVEKIDVSGGAQLAGGSTPSATLDVYSPLWMENEFEGRPPALIGQ
ncbi:hypothetical protein SprV_0802534000 [Sparganum proliferum]